ncbi:M protein, serotype 49-like, partial [Sycon ciliatum]|uniref:M protein, serotype 49-like n=1 Tax=Sycon ciliatum TaxID=27933 RepID=UPI0031F71400
MDEEEAQMLRARLQHLELMQAQLRRDKESAERDFGHQRSKFRDILMMRENELAQVQTAQRSLQAQYQRDKTELTNRLSTAQGEMDSFQQMAQVLEVSSKAELEEQKRQHQDEITSMRQILEVSADETARQNREMWLAERQQLEVEITRLRSQQASSTSAASSAATPTSSSNAAATPTQTTSSHLSTLLPTLLKRGVSEEVSDAAGKATTKDVDRGGASAAGVAGEKQEVRQLKERLKESRTKVKALQRQLDVVTKVPEGKRNGLFGNLFSSSASAAEGKMSVEEQMKQQSLQSCSRQDLETFVSALMAQKGVLQAENTDLRSRMEDTGDIISLTRSASAGPASAGGVTPSS